MDVFRLRQTLVDDYGSYVSSFIQVKDNRVEEVRNIPGGEMLRPAPLIQRCLSPKAGETIDELVGARVACTRIVPALSEERGTA